MILVVGYIVAISAGESALNTVPAFVPLTSPMIVPYRVAVGAGSALEYVVSAARSANPDPNGWCRIPTVQDDSSMRRANSA